MALQVWENWSTRYKLYTMDNFTTPVDLGKTGKLTVGGYAFPHLVKVHIEILFGEPPYDMGKGGLVVVPSDPALMEPVIIGTRGGVPAVVGPVSPGGVCWVYDDSAGISYHGFSMQAQMPGDISNPANKGIIARLPMNAGVPGLAYTVKGSNAPWGAAWAANDNITMTLDYEVP